MSAKKILIGVLAGITTGTIFGILLTSKKGVDVRKKISTNSREYADEVKAKFDNSLASLLSNYDHLEKKMGDLSKEVISSVSKMDKTSLLDGKAKT
jgi:gas vesicle protein